MAWPKGKPRGPRPPVSETSLLQESLEKAATAAFARTPTYEPVSAKAVFVSGAKVELKASSFDVAPGRYIFISFPPERGFKTVTILKADQLASLEISAPEKDCDVLLVRDAPPVTALPPPQQASGPVHFMNPIAQKIRDANATGAVNIPNPPGIPMSKITRNDEGREEIVGASLA